MIIHGYPVALGAIAFVAGAALWRYKRLHRMSAVMFGFGAFLLAIGVVPWLDALARLTASGTGVTVLVLVDIVSGVGFWFEAIRKHMHHRIRTPVLAVMFGTALMLTIGSMARLLREAARSPRKTASALGQTVSQVRSGHAAHAVNSHSALIIAGLAALALIVLIIGAHRLEKGNSKTPARSGLPQILGRPSAGTPPRRALPAGRRGR